MPITLESDGKQVSDKQLMLRGLVFLTVVVVVVTLLLARSQGRFEHTVNVTADLVNVGDGLPDHSDVKFHGVLVGTVTGVTPAGGNRPNQVRLALTAHAAGSIPATVTARVVPSNVFAVPSVQLVDNGPAPALGAGAHIPEDRSLPTVRLQTSLTALDRIAAAVGRSGADPTVGILATVERATSGRGAAAVQAAAQLDRIVQGLDAVATPDGTAATLDELTRALDELNVAAPDLLDAVHNAVVPLRAVAQEREQLTALLSGGLQTATTIGDGMQRRDDTILGITAELGPALDVLAAGGRNFTQMTTSVANVDQKFADEFWNPLLHNGTAKVIVELTPHRQYTRADCPRYGALAGPSCATAPDGGPSILDGPGTVAVPAADSAGGTVGPAGGPREREQIDALLGEPSNALSDMLIGPLVRGNDVTVRPADGEGHP